MDNPFLTSPDLILATLEHNPAAWGRVWRCLPKTFRCIFLDRYYCQWLPGQACIQSHEQFFRWWVRTIRPRVQTSHEAWVVFQKLRQKSWSKQRAMSRPAYLQARAANSVAFFSRPSYSTGEPSRQDLSSRKLERWE